MTSWHSYPSLFNLGHRAVARLTDYPVYVQEKIDGSQFSFGKFYNEDTTVAEDGVESRFELKIRSKGAVMHPEAPEKMFSKAAEWVRLNAHLLTPGWTYRGEYLRVPKHNTLAYDRTPIGNIILFDINRGEEDYLTPWEVRAEAQRIGLEAVPTLKSGMVTLHDLRDLLDNTISVLGGQKIEGVVLKPEGYALYGPDHKVLMGKFVSEAFKEVHQGEWKKNNPTKSDIIDDLIHQYRTPARWAKGVQHLREAGQLEESPRDIPKLMKEVSSDVYKEEADAIREALFKYAWPKIQRGIIAGLPEWWKEELLKQQFKQDEAA